MEFNLVITLPDNAPMADILNAFTDAAYDARAHVNTSGVPEIDEQVHLDKNIVFFRSE